MIAATFTTITDRAQRLLLACEYGGYVDVRLLRVTAGLRSIGIDDACSYLDDLVDRGWVGRLDRNDRRLYRLTSAGAHERARLRTADQYRREVACA